MSRIWCALKDAAVSTRYANFNSGPISRSTFASKGILTGTVLSTGTRQISPPYDTTIALLSGVNA